MQFFPKEGVRFGDRGWPVAVIQLVMAERGRLAPEFVTGIYDEETREAVRQFQVNDLFLPDAGCTGEFDAGTIGAVHGNFQLDMTKFGDEPFKGQFVPAEKRDTFVAGQFDPEAGQPRPEVVGP